MSVFVHSMFRSSSTFFYYLASRLDGVTAFQEPLHEYAFKFSNDPSDLLKNTNHLTVKYRHPDIKSYWSELVKAWPSWSEHAKNEYIFDCFFAKKGEVSAALFGSHLLIALLGILSS